MKKIIAIILALTFVLAFAACGKSDTESADTTAAPADDTAAPAVDTTEAPADDTGAAVVAKVMTHEEYVAAEFDTPVTVETYVQAKQSWWDGKATFYTQAEDGAYFIYNMPCTEEEFNALTPGTKIRVSGYKSQWSGEVEIIDAAYEVIDGNFIATATDVTELLGTDELEAHQNELVTFKGMTVEPKTDADGNEVAFLYNWDGSGEDGSDLYFDVSVNGNTYTFTVESYLCGPDTAVYKAVKELKVGDKIDLAGFLYWYEGPNPHITQIMPAA